MVTNNGLSSPDKTIFEIGNKLNEAVQLHQTGRLQDARGIYEKILAMDPDNTDALHLLGFISHQSGNNNTALDLITKAIRIHPEYPFYHNSLGLVLKAQGKPDDAISSYQKALDLEPEYAEAHNNMGVVLQDQGRLDEAMACYQKALVFDPNAAEAHNNMGNVLKDQDKPEDAISSYQKALALRPDYPEAHNNMGVSFQHLNQFTQAITCFRKALQLRPDYTEAFINMGIAFQYQCRLKDAMSCYEKALDIEPDNADAHFHASFSLLMSGNLQAGWKEYEWRLLKDEWKKTHTYDNNIPRWNGSSFKGKTLFVHAEQGLGDTLQFIRYLPLVKNLGGSVVFETLRPLAPLLEDFQGIDELMPLSSTRPLASEYDFYIPLMSIPGLFATSLDTIPIEIPYVHADPEKSEYWANRLPKGGFKIGLVWAGKPAPHDNRPCNLKHFFPLSIIPGLRLIGLQKGEAAGQVHGLPDKMIVTNLGEELFDFADTAGVIENLDLIISIDTSVAHLAGAMGKTVWTLIPFAPDWRWLLGRKDSPWYPTMRLFRQPEPGNWNAVLEQVAEELKKLV